MAASSGQRKNRPSQMLALALLLITQLLSAAVMAQENVRGDGVLKTTGAPVTTEPSGQVPIYPTMEENEISTKTPESHVNTHLSTIQPNPSEETTNDTFQTEVPFQHRDTPAPNTARGDNLPGPRDVTCGSKESVEGKNAVLLKLKRSGNCEDTRQIIIDVLPQLCHEDCKMELYQEENTDSVLVSGKYVEEDVTGMVDKFNSLIVKDNTDIQSATPRWGKKSKTVLVSLLLVGLLLAALLGGLYYFKTHRKNSKGVRLAESFQVDEENQANTLVSVAPLPQEPADKPTANGESPPENGANSTPTTNGHSAAQTPVADTEM